MNNIKFGIDGFLYEVEEMTEKQSHQNMRDGFIDNCSLCEARAFCRLTNGRKIFECLPCDVENDGATDKYAPTYCKRVGKIKDNDPLISINGKVYLARQLSESELEQAIDEETNSYDGCSFCAINDDCPNFGDKCLPCNLLGGDVLKEYCEEKDLNIESL